MGLEYGLLSHKTKITKDNVECLNLLSQTYNNDIDLDGNVTLVTVTHEYIGRPDLVSLAIYGNDRYADVLCKLNGISNPFDLNEGMELVCPVPSIVDQLIDNKTSEVDDSLVDDSPILKKETNNKKTYDEERSPNEATITDHNYTITNDNVLVLY